MKVLLFVQSDDARPKAIKRATKGYIKAAILDRCEAGRESWRTHNGIDRWWLVECENAENGRRVIEDARLGLGNVDDAIAAGPGSLAGPRVGRILASGGRNG